MPQVVSVKAIGIAIKLTLDGISQIAYSQTWFFLTVAAICVITQLNYLNKVSTIDSVPWWLSVPITFHIPFQLHLEKKISPTYVARIFFLYDALTIACSVQQSIESIIELVDKSFQFYIPELLTIFKYVLRNLNKRVHFFGSIIR